MPWTADQRSSTEACLAQAAAEEGARPAGIVDPGGLPGSAQRLTVAYAQ